MNSIYDILKKHGSLSSTEIFNFIKKDNNISNDAARKRIQRSVGKAGIQRLESIKFRNNTKFLYLSEDFDTKKYWDKLLSLLKKENNIYIDIINAICVNGGIVSEHDLRVYSASPDKLIGKIPYRRIQYNLIQSKIIHELGTDYNLYEINVHIMKNTSLTKNVNKQLIKEIQSRLITNWLIINGLAYKKSINNSLDSEKCYFHYYWHVYGQSYMLDAISKSKDVFIVVDFIQNDMPLYSNQIGYFLKKVESVRNQSIKANFLPILISDYFHKDTLMELRKKKIMATTTSNLLGEEVSNLLKKLQDSLFDIQRIIKDNPEQMFDVVRSLRKTVGITENLKGKLFEYFIATIVFYENGQNFEIGKLITDPKTFKKAEVDLLTYDLLKTINIYECKSYDNNLITGDDIKNWFLKTKRIINWIKEHDLYKNRDVILNYYTLSGYTDEAKSMLDKYTKYKINYLNKHDIDKKVKQLKNKDVSTTFNDFFK